MVVWTRFMDALNGLTRLAIITGFALLAIFVMMQIFWRYILVIPLPWSEEAARYLLVWVALLATAVAFRDESHIRLDVVFNRFGRRTQKNLSFVFRLIGLGFAGLLLVYGVALAKLGTFTNSPGLNITMFAAYLSIPVSAAVMILNILDSILRDRGSSTGSREGRP
jgi:TRAP-type C4-dicarboxylate transport system permease small subunit